MLLQSVLRERRRILTCENVANMSVSITESKMLCLYCRKNIEHRIGDDIESTNATTMLF